MSTLPVIFILGPTASGKTDLAMRLYDNFACDLISVDSAQIYRGMDIGTAKPSQEVLNQYPHALIDFLAPEDHYSAANFCSDANHLIKQAHANARLPVLVGGTMLYVHALMTGMSHLPKSERDVREHIEQRIRDSSLQAMHAKLLALDPQGAQHISPNDRQRIIRYHELFLLSGKKPSQLFAEQRTQSQPWQPLTIALLPERSILHQRIAERFANMMQQGFLQEVIALMNRPHLTDEHPSMRAVGYRQLWQHLAGEISLDEAIEKGIIATRQLAKRQITWMRNRLQENLSIQFFDPMVDDVYHHCQRMIETHLSS